MINIKSYHLIAWALGLSTFLYSCESRKDEKKVFNFMFNNEWDSLTTQVDKSGADLEFILNSPVRLRSKYKFSLMDSSIILQNENRMIDTIKYSWNYRSKKVRIDTL